jgi:enamine deaminase RidA (YjgF/YER057c/UK114 family)
VSTIVQPEGWLQPRGYSNGVVASGRVLFVAGQVGVDPRSTSLALPADFAAQFDRALANVVEVVRAAGGLPEHVCRVTAYVTDKREYLSSLKACGAAWQRHLGRHYPAMALVQVGALVLDEARVELEATAMLP